jgi:hypothetical protein
MEPHVSKTGKFSTHHVPDIGIWYAPGDIVRLDQSGRQIQVVKDPNGDHEVYSCRHATEYKGDPALLRVSLRRSSTVERSDPPSSLYAV